MTGAVAEGGHTASGWREVLVPVRGGPDALDRLRLSVTLAAATGARVTALYVMDERLLGDPDAALMRDKLFEQMAAEGRAVLDAARRVVETRSVACATRLERGPVVETILRVARETGADAIVVGSHRQTWLGRLLGGSVAESVLSRAPCAVLAVPPVTTTKDTGRA